MSNVEPWNIATELTSPAGTERIHAQGADPNDYYVTTSTLAAYAQVGMATDAEVATAVSDHVAASDPHGDRAHASGLVSTHSADTTSVHGITDTSALLDTGDIGTTVQGYSAVLAATTASFTTADETKLDGIEAGADVTDATNVAAAGAVMASLVDAKGDLIVATAADTVTRLAAGTDGHVLTADAAEAGGVKWAAAAGGGGGLPAQPLMSNTVYSGVPGVHVYSPSVYTWSSVVANRAVWGFFAVTAPITISSAEVRVTTAGGASAACRIGIYECKANADPGDLVADFGVISASSTGRKQITGLSATLPVGFYYSISVANEALSLECRGGYCPWWSNHPTAFSSPSSGWQGGIYTYGALSDPHPAMTGNVLNATYGIIVPVQFRW